MKRLNFYFKYAWRSVIRGGQRSFFAVLCVAVGVASRVALESLGQSISDTLSGDTQARAGGDIIATPARIRGETTVTISDNSVNKLNELKANGTISDWTSLISSSPQIGGYFGIPPTFYT